MDAVRPYACLLVQMLPPLSLGTTALTDRAASPYFECPMRTLLSRISCLYLAVAMLAGLPGPGIAVLCVGPDGHVSVEPGVVRCAHPLAPPADGSVAASHLSTDDCGPCVDVPMGADDLAARRQSTGMLSASGSAAAWTACPVHPMDRVHRLDASPACAASASLSSFPPSRTTILRN